MSYSSTIYLSKGVFGRVDFREDEKKKKKKKKEKMRRENSLESVWLREGERKIIMGSMCFLSEPIKRFSLQNGEKT